MKNKLIMSYNNIESMETDKLNQQTDESNKESSKEQKEDKIDSSNIEQKQTSADKFAHIIKKKNIIGHNLNKNNNKKRFDSSDYYRGI